MRDVVHRAITLTAATAKMVVVVLIVLTIFAMVENVSTAILDRFDVIFVKDMEDGGSVCRTQSGAREIP